MPTVSPAPRVADCAPPLIVWGIVALLLSGLAILVAVALVLLDDPVSYLAEVVRRQNDWVNLFA